MKTDVGQVVASAVSSAAGDRRTLDRLARCRDAGSAAPHCGRSCSEALTSRSATLPRSPQRSASRRPSSCRPVTLLPESAPVVASMRGRHEDCSVRIHHRARRRRRNDAHRRQGRRTHPRAVRAARDAGIDFFDHADIYGGSMHHCESRFADALQLSAAERDEIVLQTKCGIEPARGHRSTSRTSTS